MTPLLTKLIEDQDQRRRSSEFRYVEAYLVDYPELADEPLGLLELVVREYRIRRELGEIPNQQDYLRRFPQLGDKLQRQFALEGVLAAAPAAATVDLPAEDTHLFRRDHEDEAAAWPRVPGYAIECELGRGGAGVVYKAHQHRPKRIVALKMVLTGAQLAPQKMERFRAEAESIARLKHPNIVHVYEVGEHDSLPYFSLEYLPGGSLADLLDRENFSTESSAALIEVLARAIDAAHQQGIIHRDLKPENVLLAEQSTDPEAFADIVKITDFGLAKNLEEDGHTKTGDVMGTPAYMAPEQADGHTRRIGPSTDVYALGVLLYELLTGRQPFQGATLFDTLRQISRDEPKPPSQLFSQIPKDLETICLKCLEKDPSKRYRTARGLADDLGRFRRREPISARPLGRLGRTLRWSHRNPLVAGLLTLLFLSLLFGTILTSYFAVQSHRKAQQEEASKKEANRQTIHAQNKEAEATREKKKAQEHAQRLKEESELVRRHLYDAHMLLTQQAWNDGQGTRVAELLEGQRPKPGQVDMRSFEWNYWNRLVRRTHSILPMPAPVADETSVVRFRIAWSPDGKYLAAGRARDAVVWDANTSRVFRTLPMTPKKNTRIEVGIPQKDLLFVDHSLRKVEVFRISTGEKVASWERTPFFMTNDFTFTPDGKRVIFAGRTGGKGQDRSNVVRIYDLFSGNELQTLHFDETHDIEAIAISGDGKFLVGVDEFWKIVWDLEKAKVVFQEKERVEQCVAFHPDSKRFAHASRFAIGIRDTESFTRVMSLPVGARFGLTFSPNGKHLAILTNRGIEVRDIDSGREAYVLRADRDLRGFPSFSPDGRRIAVRTLDGKVVLFPAQDQEAHTFECRSWAISPNGKRLALVQNLRLAQNHSAVDLELWDTTTWKQLGKRRLPQTKNYANVKWLKFSPDSSIVHVCQYTGAGKIKYDIRGWKLDSNGKLVQTKRRIGLYLEFARTAGLTICQGANHSIFSLQETRTRKEVKVLRGLNPILSPDGSKIALLTAERNGKRLFRVFAEIWDLKSLEKIARVPTWTSDRMPTTGNLDGKWGVFSPSGKRLVVRYSEREFFDDNGREIPLGKPISMKTHTGIRIFDTKKGKLLEDIPLPTNRNWSRAGKPIAIDSKSRLLAVGLSDGTIRVWDTKTLSPLPTLRGHSKGITGLSFSPDGKRLVSSSTDTTVKLWNLSTSQNLLTFHHIDSVNEAEFDSTGHLLASRDGLGHLKVWDSSPAK